MASFRQMCVQARAQRTDKFRDMELKAESRARLTAAGFATAETYATCHRRDLVAKVLKHERCVAKPAEGSAGIGVMGLERLDAEIPTWQERFRNRLYDERRISAMTRAVVAEYPTWGDDWLVEEMLLGAKGALPDEFQVHLFGAVVPFIRQRRAGPPLWYRYWSPDGDCMTDELNKGDLPMSTTIERPARLGPFIDMARAVSEVFGEANFVRVDVLDTDRGLVIGEVNAWVGAPNYPRHWDRRLGELWMQAGGI